MVDITKILRSLRIFRTRFHLIPLLVCLHGISVWSMPSSQSQNVAASEGEEEALEYNGDGLRALLLDENQSDDPSIIPEEYGGSLTEMRDRNGDTPLHWSVYRGKINCLRYLLSQGLDVNARNLRGETPLYLSVYYFKQECLKLLAAQQDFEKGSSCYRNYWGDTLLHSALHRENEKGVELLLAADCDVFAEDSDGALPLALATKNKNLFSKTFICACIRIFTNDNEAIVSQCKRWLFSTMLTIRRLTGSEQYFQCICETDQDLRYCAGVVYLHELSQGRIPRNGFLPIFKDGAIDLIRKMILMLHFEWKNVISTNETYCFPGDFIPQNLIKIVRASMTHDATRKLIKYFVGHVWLSLNDDIMAPYKEFFSEVKDGQITTQINECISVRIDAIKKRKQAKTSVQSNLRGESRASSSKKRRIVHDTE